MTDYRTCSQGGGPRAASTSGVKTVARLAWLVVAFNIAIILWGAYVRVCVEAYAAYTVVVYENL